MSTARQEAINNEYDKNRNGRVGFNYVNTQTLDRLGITQYKTEPRDNFMRIMPPKDEAAMWAKEVWVHRNIGANGVTLVCPKKMKGKPCPICEKVEEMKASGADDKEISAIVATRRYLMFVYDVRDETTIAKGLRWFDAPGIIVANTIGLSKDRRTGEIIDVCDPIDGRDIEFTRKGTGLSSKYESFALAKTDPIPEGWYKNVPEFDEVIVTPTYEQMKTEFDGGVSNDDEQPAHGGSVSEEQEIPAQEQSTSRRRRSEEPAKQEESSGTQTQTRRNSTSDSVKQKLDEIRRRQAAR